MGAKPEGVPIVHTDDIYGNPDKVRIIPKERYRRLQTYANLPISKLLDKNPRLNGVSIVQQSEDESDLALQFLVDKNTRMVRQQLPNQVQEVPVVHQRQPLESTPEALQGGSPVDYDGSGGPNGTLTLACYDKGSNDRVAITADHVMNGESTMYSYGDPVADFRTRDNATDTTAYTIRGGESVDIRGTVNIPNITGAWRFTGLADKVGNTDDGDTVADGGTVNVQLYGRTSGRVDDYCNNTKRTGKIDYQADMKRHRTTGGDSGGPWVDNNGKLLACHYGYAADFDNEWSIGSIGRPSLNTVGAKLYY
jgi:hypothetical protein